jgi:isopentenyl-diphosphate Delta-isomerase
MFGNWLVNCDHRCGNRQRLMTLAFDQVELLDPSSERTIGNADKLAAHRDGAYHRAISILLTDKEGRHVLQRRSAGKYHCAGLWANACCSHPAPGEPSADAARRRLAEELGVEVPLYRLGVIRYSATVPALHCLANCDGTLIERERVALFCGRADSRFAPDPSEVSEMIALSHVDSLNMPASNQAPWLRLYLHTFGSCLDAIVDACISGDWVLRDFGVANASLNATSCNTHSSSAATA